MSLKISFRTSTNLIQAKKKQSIETNFNQRSNDLAKGIRMNEAQPTASNCHRAGKKLIILAIIIITHYRLLRHHNQDHLHDHKHNRGRSTSKHGMAWYGVIDALAINNNYNILNDNYSRRYLE